MFKKGNKLWKKRKVFRHTKEFKKMMRRKRLGINNPFYGKKHKIKTKIIMSIKQKGSNHPNWKGGRRKHNLGYILIYKPEHPFSSKLHCIFEHRLVIEKIIGRYLLTQEEVHHLGKKNDNRPNMLIAFISHSAHKRFERGGIVKFSEIIFDGRKL